VQTLRGWRPNQQGSLNQVDQQKPLGTCNLKKYFD